MAARFFLSFGPMGWSTIPYDSGAMSAGVTKGRITVLATIGVSSLSSESGYLT
jgi:hypothetical protein